MAATATGLSAAVRKKRAELLEKQKVGAKPAELKLNAFSKDYGDNTYDVAVKSQAIREANVFRVRAEDLNKVNNAFAIRSAGHIAIVAYVNQAAPASRDASLYVLV